MPTITEVGPVPRQPGRVAVQVDGQHVGTLFVEDAARFALIAGREIEQRELDALLHEAAALKTYDRGLRMLAARGRSVQELRRRLLAAKEPEEHVDAALERLAAMGALNDEDYARQLARSQLVGRGYAPRRVKQELARRGISRDVADRAIDVVLVEDAAPGSYGAEEGVDLSETIERIARKKMRGLGSVDAETRERRLYAFLACRGYDSDAILRVLRKVSVDGSAHDV